MRFVKRLSELKPDVIHLHNLHGYYVNIQVLFDYLKTQISLLSGLSMTAGPLPDTARIS